VFEVYPSANPGQTWKRLISVNGTPLPPAELAQRDERHRADVLGRMRLEELESPAARAKRLRDDAARERRRAREVDEAIGVFDYRVAGYERLALAPDPLVVLVLTPRRQAQASSDLPRYLRKFRGRAWVEPREGQVVRVELEALEPINVGLGLVGRVHQGSRATFERRKVNDEIWLPSRATIEAAGRTLVFRKFTIKTETLWWDYKKFSVETNVTSTIPRDSPPPRHEHRP